MANLQTYRQKFIDIIKKAIGKTEERKKELSENELLNVVYKTLKRILQIYEQFRTSPIFFTLNNIEHIVFEALFITGLTPMDLYRQLWSTYPLCSSGFGNMIPSRISAYVQNKNTVVTLECTGKESNNENIKIPEFVKTEGMAVSTFIINPRIRKLKKIFAIRVAPEQEYAEKLTLKEILSKDDEIEVYPKE